MTENTGDHEPRANDDAGTADGDAARGRPVDGAEPSLSGSNADDAPYSVAPADEGAEFETNAADAHVGAISAPSPSHRSGAPHHSPTVQSTLPATRHASRSGGWGGWLLVVLIGVVARAPMVAQDGLGHEPDMRLFRKWARSVTEHGLTDFYVRTGSCNYPPVFVLGWWGLGSALELVDEGLKNQHLLHAALKLPASICDLLIALILFIEGRRLLGRRRGIAASALYFLNPAVMYNSAYWGQVDAVYTFLVLASLVFAFRRQWTWSGVAFGVALLAKFQSIAFLPLVFLEPYRQRGWRSVGWVVVGMVLAAVPILAPFALTDTLDDVIERAYTGVVGQYPELSTNAFNVWWWLGTPEVLDDSVPYVLAAVAANGADTVSLDASPLLDFDWRRVSLIAYAAAVALILSIHTYLRAPLSWYGTAGLLGLAFFLIPTEMHERYAHPALAMLALWAVGGPWRERMFILVSMLLLLNLTHPQPVEAVGSYIGAGLVLSFVALVAWIVVERVRSFGVAGRGVAPPAPPPPPELIEPLPPRRVLVRLFRIASFAGCAALSAAAISAVVIANLNTAGLKDDGDVYLHTLAPTASKQGWGRLRANRSVLGGVLQMGDTIYLRGLGAHAPSVMEYEIPEGYTEFVARVGIDAGSRGQGSAVARVLLDGAEVFASSTLTEESGPVDVRVPLGDARQLTVRAEPTPDGQTSDHVDWALARFTREP